MRLPSIAYRFAAILALSAVIFSGCSTELDSNADYKEVIVLYSILDPDQTTHYAKVNKAFLNTKSNALTIAANNPDSTQYGDEMKVVLQKLRPGPDSLVVSENAMERFISTGKEAGTFFAGDQVLYRTTGSVALDQEAVYRIKATNTKTGVIATGATELVKDKPLPSSTPGQGFCIYQISQGSPIGFPCYTVTQPSAYNPHLSNNRVTFRKSPNARIYTIKLTFKFAETTNGNREDKQVEWYLRNNFINDSPTSDPEILLEKNFFTTNLLALIDRSQDNNTTTREAGDVLITVTGGSSTLELYYRINNSFSLISQTRPEFDNINNGTGLVASRRSKVARGFLTADAKVDLANRTELKFQP